MIHCILKGHIFGYKLHWWGVSVQWCSSELWQGIVRHRYYIHSVLLPGHWLFSQLQKQQSKLPQVATEPSLVVHVSTKKHSIRTWGKKLNFKLRLLPWDVSVTTTNNIQIFENKKIAKTPIFTGPAFQKQTYYAKILWKWGRSTHLCLLPTTNPPRVNAPSCLLWFQGSHQRCLGIKVASIWARIRHLYLTAFQGGPWNMFFLSETILFSYPMGSMYGILTYIYHKNQPNVGKYTIHRSYGYCFNFINITLHLFFVQVLVFLYLYHPHWGSRFLDPQKLKIATICATHGTPNLSKSIQI